MQDMTTKDKWTAIIGLLSAIVWMFGSKAGIPPEAVQFASATVIGAVGHAVGSAGNTPIITLPATEAQDQSKSA